MMQPGGGMPHMDPTLQQQQQPGALPSAQHFGGPPPPQQWGMIPPPAPQYHQQQHQPMAPPPAMWAQQQQIPPPMHQQQHIPPQQHHQQMQHYIAPQHIQQPTDETKSLWIGDLQYWMDESYLNSCFANTGEVLSVKIIRNKQTGQPEGYGFIEFRTHAAAEQVLQTYNGQMMPSSEQTFRLNWAGAGERRGDDGSDHTIFVGDLASDVTDFMLQELFRAHYPSVKGAKVVTDRATGRSKGYGFVRFGDLNEQTRAMAEMNGMLCSSRPIRTGPAANKKSTAFFQATTQVTDSENDPNNTTIFVGGLDPNVPEETLRQVFSQYGDLVHVKIPVGKRCGFVQFASRQCAEEALRMLNGTQLGGQHIRLSWGRSPSNKQQSQTDANQWNGNYYGYGQSYDAYGYTQPAQDPNMYAYAAYQYGNYQQPPQQQQQQ